MNHFNRFGRVYRVAQAQLNLLKRYVPLVGRLGERPPEIMRRQTRHVDLRPIHPKQLEDRLGGDRSAVVSASKALVNRDYRKLFGRNEARR